jgi:hypothetical protein
MVARLTRRHGLPFQVQWTELQFIGRERPYERAMNTKPSGWDRRYRLHAGCQPAATETADAADFAGFSLRHQRIGTRWRLTCSRCALPYCVSLRESNRSLRLIDRSDLTNRRVKRGRAARQQLRSSPRRVLSRYSP